MRNSVDSQAFLEEVKGICRGHIREFDTRKTVVDNPNFLGYRIFQPSLNDLINLSILSWYGNEEFLWYVRELVLEKLVHLCLEDQLIVKLLLVSKAQMENFLLDTSLWHTREFFGNLLAKNVLERLRYSENGGKVKYPQRKRGYHDHGSLVEVHRWKPKHDYSLTDLQQKIEKERDCHEATVDFIIGLIT